MEGARWPDEDDLAQLEGILSAPLSVEEQNALAKEINRIFEEYGDFIDSVLSLPDDVVPEERTTAPSSFQSNTAPEIETSIQSEREQNIADGRRPNSASPSIVSSRNGQLIGGDNGGDDRDLRSLPILSTRLSFGPATLSPMKDDNGDKEGAGNVTIPKINTNKVMASAPATFASDDGMSHSDQATSSDHEVPVSWPLERRERGNDLLNGRPNSQADISRVVTSPVEQGTARLWARSSGSARRLPFPFVRDPRLYLPGLADPGMTTAPSADQALRVLAPFMEDAGLPLTLQMNFSAPAVGGPSPTDANPPSSRMPLGESHNASLVVATASRQSEAGPSRRRTRVKKAPGTREPESSRTCTLETCKNFGKVYNCRKDLLRHVKHGKDHRGQPGSLPPRVCPLCLKKLSRNDSVNRHLRKMHGVSTASLS